MDAGIPETLVLRVAALIAAGSAKLPLSLREVVQLQPRRFARGCRAGDNRPAQEGHAGQGHAQQPRDSPESRPVDRRRMRRRILVVADARVYEVEHWVSRSRWDQLEPNKGSQFFLFIIL